MVSTPISLSLSPPPTIVRPAHTLRSEYCDEDVALIVDAVLSQNDKWYVMGNYFNNVRKRRDGRDGGSFI